MKAYKEHGRKGANPTTAITTERGGRNGGCYGEKAN